MVALGSLALIWMPDVSNNDLKAEFNINLAMLSVSVRFKVFSVDMAFSAS
jgi:hypothetical protein